MAASVSFSIPPESPLAQGWRAAVVFALKRHGLHAVLDTIAAFAELRMQHEPDNPRQRPKGHRTPVIGNVRSDLGSWLAASFPTRRRIEENNIPRGRGRPPLEEVE